MGTTATGLRYPEPADPASAGALNFKNLADDVTGKYPPQAAYGTGLDGVAIPANTVLKTAAGKTSLTTDAAGQVVFTIPGGWTGNVATMQILSTVGVGGGSDYTFSVAPRTANSVYLYLMKAGVKLGSTAFGFTYLAMGY